MHSPGRRYDEGHRDLFLFPCFNSQPVFGSFCIVRLLLQRSYPILFEPLSGVLPQPNLQSLTYNLRAIKTKRFDDSIDFFEQLFVNFDLDIYHRLYSTCFVCALSMSDQRYGRVEG
jgi:hypothetical protein